MTAPSIKEALKLKPCPFCGCGDIKFNHPNKEMGWRGSINCPACLVTMPRECGDQELIDCWNERAALATLQPDGERREVIARILADPKHQERARYVQGFLYGDDHVIRDVALRENQEIFRTKDEHEYEQRLEIEKAKFAAGAILASGLVQDEVLIALKRELEDCQSAVAIIEVNLKSNNETQSGNYRFYQGRVVSLQFAIKVIEGK